MKWNKLNLIYRMRLDVYAPDTQCSILNILCTCSSWDHDSYKSGNINILFDQSSFIFTMPMCGKKWFLQGWTLEYLLL